MDSNEVRVKNEPIYESQSILETSDTNQANSLQSNNKHLIKHERKSISVNDNKQTGEAISSDENPNNEQSNKRKRQSKTSMRIKEEPIDIGNKTSKSHIDVKAEEEEKFSATEEFVNKASITFLNEETKVTSIDNHPKTINSQTNNPQKKKTHQLDNSK